jgi:hypothetical protein
MQRGEPLYMYTTPAYDAVLRGHTKFWERRRLLLDHIIAILVTFILDFV